MSACSRDNIGLITSVPIQVVFTKEEIAEAKNFGDLGESYIEFCSTLENASQRQTLTSYPSWAMAGITLIGFKPKEALKIYYNLTHPYFIYPDDSVCWVPLPFCFSCRFHTQIVFSSRPPGILRQHSRLRCPPPQDARSRPHRHMQHDTEEQCCTKDRRTGATSRLEYGGAGNERVKFIC